MSEPLKQQVQRAHIYRFPCGEPAELPRDLPFAAIGNAAWWTRWTRWREVAASVQAYVSMRTNQPLTITVEQAAEVLGIGRSTAYELVRTGELSCIRLRRRIVIPVAHLADRLGVDREAVWAVLAAAAVSASADPSRAARSGRVPSQRRTTSTLGSPSLF